MYKNPNNDDDEECTLLDLNEDDEVDLDSGSIYE